jgi:hypothetical protein
MAPGWVRTEMGGSDAHLSIDESIPNLVKTLDALQKPPTPSCCAPPAEIRDLSADDLSRLAEIFTRLLDGS